MTEPVPTRTCPRCDTQFTPRGTAGLAGFIYVLVLCGLLSLQKAMEWNAFVSLGVWIAVLVATYRGMQYLAASVQRTCPACGNEVSTPIQASMAPPEVTGVARSRGMVGSVVRAIVFVVCVALVALWWFRDELQSEAQVHELVDQAQLERHRDGRQRLVVEFDLSGEVSAVDASTGTITLWGSASPVDVPKDVRWEQVDGWMFERSTLVVRNVDPASTAVGLSVRSKAYFVERRAVPGRVGQAPIYEWVYDMDERVALKRLRQAKAEHR